MPKSAVPIAALRWGGVWRMGTARRPDAHPLSPQRRVCKEDIHLSACRLPKLTFNMLLCSRCMCGGFNRDAPDHHPLCLIFPNDPVLTAGFMNFYPILQRGPYAWNCQPCVTTRSILATVCLCNVV
eukprot:EG_transcript_36520